ncbi:hypothetical protein B0I35DRAFT_436874 [Stachybotrys elegans]|uniref:Uncharacterized protein n=1 Tax=Stachybotrys elegans TaxID=80388 RepID=A0A8K0SJV8_9HYPO|nr:hypothetical protein B0I35DRAFT_436874 [Stachybotrys elegans]
MYVCVALFILLFHRDVYQGHTDLPSYTISSKTTPPGRTLAPIYVHASYTQSSQCGLTQMLNRTKVLPGEWNSALLPPPVHTSDSDHREQVAWDMTPHSFGTQVMVVLHRQ